MSAGQCIQCHDDAGVAAGAPLSPPAKLTRLGWPWPRDPGTIAPKLDPLHENGLLISALGFSFSVVSLVRTRESTSRQWDVRSFRWVLPRARSALPGITEYLPREVPATLGGIVRLRQTIVRLAATTRPRGDGNRASSSYCQYSCLPARRAPRKRGVVTDATADGGRGD